MKKIYMIPDISRVKVESYNICAGSPQKIVWKVDDGGGEDEGPTDSEDPNYDPWNLDNW